MELALLQKLCLLLAVGPSFFSPPQIKKKKYFYVYVLFVNVCVSHVEVRRQQLAWNRSLRQP